MFNKMKKHGMRYTRFYTIWSGVKNRCLSISSKDYKNYGGRGIKLDKKWCKFENFISDMYESYKLHCEVFGEKDTQIDRIDNNKGYSKRNCRWATKKEQASNRRKIDMNKKGRDMKGRFRTLENVKSL